jgi:hypothetical protein
MQSSHVMRLLLQKAARPAALQLWFLYIGQELFSSAPLFIQKALSSSNSLVLVE